MINFFEKKNLKCVVLTSGGGTRLFPLTSSTQKTMLIVNNKPLLGHVIDYWKQFTNEFIFMVDFKKEDVIDYVKKLPIKSEFIQGNKDLGIAEVINLAKEHVSNNFIVLLGDCICKGNFKFPENFSQGVGVWPTSNEEDIKRSYSIKITDNFISSVEEKPKKLISNLCGMGFYFFNKVVFENIKKTPPSKRTEKVEITDVIQTMIDSGLKISPIFFEGDYLNVTYPEDLKRASNLLI